MFLQGSLVLCCHFLSCQSLIHFCAAREKLPLVSLSNRTHPSWTGKMAMPFLWAGIAVIHTNYNHWRGLVWYTKPCTKPVKSTAACLLQKAFSPLCLPSCTLIMQSLNIFLSSKEGSAIIWCLQGGNSLHRVSSRGVYRANHNLPVPGCRCWAVWSTCTTTLGW